MIQKQNCILVYSDMNTWIDFCILVSDKDFNKAMEVTARAYMIGGSCRMHNLNH